MTPRDDRRDTQPRPRGRLYSITPEWRRELKAKLAAGGRGAKTRLAEQIGSTPAAITVVLRPSTSGSRLVRPISEALGIPMPSMIARSEQDHRWMRAGRALSRDDWQRLLEIAESLAKARK